MPTHMPIVSYNESCTAQVYLRCWGYMHVQSTKYDYVLTLSYSRQCMYSEFVWDVLSHMLGIVYV